MVGRQSVVARYLLYLIYALWGWYGCGCADNGRLWRRRAKGQTKAAAWWAGQDDTAAGVDVVPVTARERNGARIATARHEGQGASVGGGRCVSE